MLRLDYMNGAAYAILSYNANLLSGMWIHSSYYAGGWSGGAACLGSASNTFTFNITSSGFSIKVTIGGSTYYGTYMALKDV